MSVTFYPNYCFYVGFPPSTEPTITGETYTRSDGETQPAPVFDLLDNNDNTIVTIDSSAQTTTPVIDIDLTASITSADFVIIANHNLGTDRAWVSITHGGTGTTEESCYSGALGEETGEVTLDAGEFQFSSSDEDGTAVMNFAAASDDNWEINFGYDASHAADITIGEIAVGKKYSTSINPDRVIEYSAEYGNIINQAMGGGRHGIQTHGRRRGWVLSWTYLTLSDITSIETVFQITGGDLRPFWIDLGEGTNPQLYFVRFAAPLQYRKTTASIFEWQLAVEEEL